MKKLTILILFVCVYQYINAQSLFDSKKNILPEKPVLFEGFWLERIEKPSSKLDIRGCFGSVRNILTPIYPVKISDYVSTLGVICRQEIKLDKITPLPFRFRLGSLDYVNWMERKPNAILNQNR